MRGLISDVMDYMYCVLSWDMGKIGVYNNIVIET